MGNICAISYVSQRAFYKQGQVLVVDLTQQRISILTLFITALGGVNSWSVGAIWPLECQTLFTSDPKKSALYMLPFGFALLAGVIVINIGISLFRGANRELLA